MVAVGVDVTSFRAEVAEAFRPETFHVKPLTRGQANPVKTLIWRVSTPYESHISQR